MEVFSRFFHKPHEQSKVEQSVSPDQTYEDFRTSFALSQGNVTQQKIIFELIHRYSPNLILNPETKKFIQQKAYKDFVAYMDDSKEHGAILHLPQPTSLILQQTNLQLSIMEMTLNNQKTITIDKEDDSELQMIKLLNQSEIRELRKASSKSLIERFIINTILEDDKFETTGRYRKSAKPTDDTSSSIPALNRQFSFTVIYLEEGKITKSPVINTLIQDANFRFKAMSEKDLSKLYKKYYKDKPGNIKDILNSVREKYKKSLQ